MKKTITIFAIVFFLTLDIYPQSILNSVDVKLKAPLKSVWEYKTNSTLLNEKISGNNCYINTLNGIQAISLNDGKQVWNYDFPKDKSISSVVTFSEKYGVYINYKKNRSSLMLIDLSSGKEKWSIKSKEVWHKPAAIINNNFIVCIAGPPKDWNSLKEYIDMKLDVAKLTAYKIEDGTVAWEIELSDEDSDLLCVTNENAFISFDFDYSDTGLPKNKVMCYSVSDGKELWEYNPSGMVFKVMVGGMKVFNSDVYTYPQYGGNGQIARVDIKTGDEKWNQTIANQRSFITSGSDIFNSSSAWQCFKLSNGDKIFAKSLVKSSFSFGSLMGMIAGNMFANSFIGVLIGSVANIASTIAGLFPGEGQEPSFIPTQYLFEELLNEDVANDKGLFSVVRDKDEVTFIIMSNKESDDRKVEKKFPASALDLSLSNGTNDNSIFATSKGKVYSLNIQDGSIDWEKDFSNGAKETSLGLIINTDKMYLFTDEKVCQLVSE